MFTKQKQPLTILWDKSKVEIPPHIIVPIDEATSEQSRKAIGFNLDYVSNQKSYIVPV